MKICLDAGHGGSSTGAAGKYSLEKDINLKLVLMLRDKLTRNGIDIVLTRSDDSFIDLQPRCDIANRANCDYFISIHCNGFGDPSAWGTSTFYYNGSSEGYELAKAIQTAAVKYNKNKDRGVMTADFYVLSYTNMPAVLHETAFITNRTEEDMLNSSEWQEGITDTITAAVINYLGMTPIEEKLLYRVFLDGVQKGAYESRVNAVQKAEELFAEISSRNVKIISSDGEVILDRTKTPDAPIEKVSYKVTIDTYNAGVYYERDKALRFAEQLLKGISSGRVMVVTSKGEVIYDRAKGPLTPKQEIPVHQAEAIIDDSKHLISGISTASAVQMERFAHNINPDAPYLAEKYLSYGNMEGIKGDMAYAQAILETGYFRFTGDVNPDQNNFAGLGATGGGVAGARFATADQGVLAHIQHLKAYANIEPLKTELIDPRFDLVTRGSAPYWEDLNGKWAVPGNGYGQEIVEIWKSMLDEL